MLPGSRQRFPFDLVLLLDREMGKFISIGFLAALLGVSIPPCLAQESQAAPKGTSGSVTTGKSPTILGSVTAFYCWWPVATVGEWQAESIFEDILTFPESENKFFNFAAVTTR